MQSYRDLIVWQKSFKLCLDIYRITKNFPKSEIYGLTSQIRRAAVAIPSNIAEGYSRRSKLEYLQFLSIAFASGAELETQILIAKECHFLNEVDFDMVNSLLSEVMKMLNTMIKNLRISH